MAILGTVSELLAQTKMSANLKRGLDYLQNTDLKVIFSKLEVGEKETVILDDKKVFAIYQVYNSKEDALKFEGHKKYIDVQFVFDGKELMHVAGINKITKDDAYNTEKDVYFPMVEEFSTFRLDNGLGCILYPEDLHSPGNCVEKASVVHKVVVKVAIE